MKFKSIKLHNFMRYKGDNTITFSTDKEKNVTVVLGDNTFGKTTLAQAFRWGLFEELNDTNYTKKKDIVLLNNEVIAEMSMVSDESVWVEIIIENEGTQWRFVRKAKFKRKNTNQNLDVRQLGQTQLTMQILEQDEWGDIINNDGNNKDKKKYKEGCVQETIENMLPRSLSNYFFFDGERWKDLKSKTSDIKESIEMILGVSGLVKMKEHLNGGRTNVISELRAKINGAGNQGNRLECEIREIEEKLETLNNQIAENKSALETVNRIIEETTKTLNDNRKIEEDQRELANLEMDIKNMQKDLEGYYSDFIKKFSTSAKFFTGKLFEKFSQIIASIDLSGKDIPGVTVDTIDYLLEEGKCICGTDLSENTEAFNYMMQVRKQVPPEMLGGAAGKLKDQLEEWNGDTKTFYQDMKEIADKYENKKDQIIDKEDEKERLEKKMDKKTNLGPVRERKKEAEKRKDDLSASISKKEYEISCLKKEKKTKEDQVDVVAKANKENQGVYRAIAYAEELYKKTCARVTGKQNVILQDLNEIIENNFQRMFNDKEKYARLQDDYKVHVYYRQLGDLTNYEEETLSNGETIAINFVFIVSILELANKYREEEEKDSEEGMKNAVLGLPLVLDGPFSALSNDNTGLVANRLPQFAEQVIIFMLDKDWEASGLEKYTSNQYCYRVSKELTSNSSSLQKE